MVTRLTGLTAECVGGMRWQCGWAETHHRQSPSRLLTVKDLTLTYPTYPTYYLGSVYTKPGEP